MKYPTSIAFVLLGTMLCTVPTSCNTDASANVAEGETAETSEGGRTSVAVRRSRINLLPAAPRTKTIHVSVSGRVVPEHQTQVLTEVQGRILPTSRSFKAGETFRRGEVLLRIDAREFALNLESQRSAFLNVLTGMMPDLKADYPANYSRWLAYVQAYRSGESLPALPKTKADGEKYFVTANQVYNTFYSIKAQEERLRKYVIRAPYDGLITEAQADVGGMVSPGQVLGTIISSRRYELEAGVPLKAASTLSVGDQISFRSNEVDGTWTGQVVRINQVVDPQTQNVPVFFRVPGPQLTSGMYLEGEWATQRYEAVSVIPKDALVRDESVLVLQENVIVRKPVTPVEYLRDSVIVRGLAEQDQVITNQFETPVEGKKVSE